MPHQPIPSRNQLARISGGDQDLLRAWELLFRNVGGEIPSVELDNELTIGIALGKAVAAEIQLVTNTRRIKSNEVLLWLSM